MPTQVIVVKRSRRSLFAGPRALPDWFRSAWATLLRNPPIESKVAVQRSHSARPETPVSFPRLLRDARGAHRCTGCNLCVQVCPSRCLTLGTEGDGSALRVTRFGLRKGACIGCGLCNDACPENAIEMATAALAELAPRRAASPLTDLLTIEA